MAEHEQLGIMDVSVEEHFRELDRHLRGIKGMNLARWKLAQNTLMSFFVLVLAIEAGADPTISVAVIALINGISIADLATIWGKRSPSVDETETQTDK